MRIRRLWRSLASLLTVGCASPELPVTERISLDGLQSVFQRFVAADGAVVVISVVATRDFVQFTGGSAGITMDFPLVTSEQRAREAAIRRFFAARDLTIVDNVGTNGARFLDIELAPDPERLAELTRAVLIELLGASTSSQLEVASEGLGPAA